MGLLKNLTLTLALLLHFGCGAYIEADGKVKSGRLENGKASKTQGSSDTLPIKLVFKDEISEKTVNQCLELAVELSDDQDQPVVNGGEEILVQLDDGGDPNGEFYTDRTCTSLMADKTTVIKQGDSTTSAFFYKTTTPGVPVLIADDGKREEAILYPVIVDPDKPQLAFTSNPTSATAGSCEILTVQLQNKNGNSYKVKKNDLTVTFKDGNDSTAKFYSDSSCTSEISTLSIAVGASNTAIFYTQKTASGTHRITATATDISPASANWNVAPAAPFTYVFTGSPLNQNTSDCGVLNVALLDAHGNRSPAGGGSTLTLSDGASGAFYTDSICTATTTTVNVAPGASTTGNFYYKNANPGSYTLTADHATLSDATLAATINPGPVAQLVFSVAPTSQDTSACGQLDLQAQDATGYVVTAGSDITVNLTSSVSGSFYSDSGCSTSITSTTISNGSSTSGSFYYQQTTAQNSVTLTGATLGLTSATTSVDIVVGAITKLLYSTSFTSLSTGACGELVVGTHDAHDNLVTGTALTLNLSDAGDTNGAFYSDSGCTTTITSISLSSTSGETASFYYKNIAGGTKTLTSAHASYADAVVVSTVTTNTLAPTNLAAVVDASGEIDLSWDAVAGATNYTLYFATTTGVSSASGTAIALGNVTSYTHTGRTNNTAYYYVITATASGISPDSTEVGATPLAAPTSFAASSDTSAEIDLSWNAVSGAASYDIYFRTATGVNVSNGTLISNVTSPYTHSGLTNGTRYYYTIIAKNASGQSSAAGQQDAMPLAAPSIAATLGDTQNVINWSAVTGADSYDLYWDTSGSPTSADNVITGVSSSYSHTGLTNGTTYYYRLVAKNSGGDVSSVSNEVNAIPQIPAPATPTSFSAVSSTSGQVALSWGAASGATSYNIYYATSSGVTSATGSAITLGNVTSYSHTGLTNGTTLYYVITATNAGGTSSDSTEDSATPLAAPTIAVAGADQATTVSWSAVTGADSYDLYWNTTGSPTSSATVISGVTSPYIHNSLTNGTTYYYRLVAKTSASDVSSLSNEVNATPQVAAPSAPTSLAATVDTSGEIDLSWNAAAGATSYTLYFATTTGVTSGTGTSIALANVTTYTHTGRTNGTTYYYIVTATNGGGTSADSSEASATSLAAPSSVAATSDSSNEIDVSWGAVTGATGYDLYFGTSTGVTSGTGTQIANVSSPYTHTGRTNGTDYYYIVVAKGADGNSSDSSQDSARSLAAPSISVAGGNALNTVSWAAVTGADSYDLYWNTSGSPTASDNVVSGVTSPYSHTGRTNGTTYYYSLVAKTSGGDVSDQSAADSATPQVPAPSAPTSVAASVDTSGEIDLSWDAMSGATSYTVYWATSTGVTSGTGTAISLANVTSYTHTGRTNGTEYFYVVTATNAGGTSADSSEVSATSLAAPASVAATADASGEVDVSWNAVTGASGYDLYFGTSSGVTSGTGTQVTGVTSPYTHTGRTNGTAYYYIVVAKSSDGTSSDSSEDSATPLAAPSSVAAVSDTSGEIDISWTGVTGATAYDLYFGTTSGTSSSTGTLVSNVTSPYTHSSRTNGTAYFYVLVAKNASDRSSDSSEDSSTPLAQPSISVSSGDQQTAISWSAVTGANSYDLYWNTTGSPTSSDNVISGVSSSHSHTGLTNGTTYYYSLVAKTTGGDISPQSAVDSEVPQVGPPSAPTSLAASVDTSGEIDLSWDASAGATSYTVYWATSTGVTSGTGTAISLANVTSYTHTGRTNGTEYFYVVTATNAGGTSADSSEVSATSLAAPASVAATADASGEVDVSWNAVTGASGYDLYFGTSSGVTSGTGTQVTGVTSPYTHTGRTNGTAYYYIVVAKSSDGTSSDSSEDSATPLATPSISVAGGNTQTTTTWSAVTGANSYDLYWNTTGSPTSSDTVITGVTSPYSHTGLTNGTAYHYSLVAKTSGGDISAQSAVDSATPQVPAPSAPTSVAASVDTSGEIDLSWDAMSGATSYTVYWATSTGVTSGTGTAISLANVTSYTHTGRTNGTEYFYVVTATNAGGTSADSSEVSATSLAAPASVAATADASGEVDVSWNAVTGASGYDLYFGTSSGVTSGTGTQVSGVTSPYTHTGRTNGTAYYYIVVAKSSDGTSSDSSEDSATPLATPSISVAGGNAQTTVSWSGITAANSYDLYWNTTGSPTSSDTVITGVTSPYSHTGRTNGTTYHYSLVAKTSGGDISAQSTVDSATPQVPAPSAPTGFSASSDASGEIDLSWVAAAGATSYSLYFATSTGVTSSTGTEIALGNVTSYTHTGRTNGTSYYYIVTAINAGGTSSDSSEVNATALAQPAISVSAGNTQNSISWSAITGADSYDLYWNTTGSPTAGDNVISGVTSSYAHTGLTNGTTYYYSLVAKNSNSDISTLSAVGSATPQVPAPSAPTSVAASVDTSGEIDLSWDAMSGATSYTVYWATSTGVTSGTGTAISLGNVTSYTHTGRTNGTEYFYVVTATNAGGTSADSSEVSATSLAAPASVAATADASGEVDVSWNAVTGASGYDLYFGTSSGVTSGTGTQVSGVTSPYTHTGRTNGTAYYYIVVAKSSDGTSSDSSEDSATPLATPSISVAGGNTQTTTTWSAVTGANSYDLYWNTTGSPTASDNVLTGVTSPYNHTSRTNGTAYHYSLVAKTSGGDISAQSAVDSATPQVPAPSAPTSVAASVDTSGEIDLSWDAMSGATSYTVYWATSTGVTSGTGTAISLANVTSYTHTGRTNGTEYFYVVTATNAGGTSADSSEVSATSLAAPASVAATADASGEVDVSWNAVTGASGYDLYFGTSSGVTSGTGTQVTGVTSPYTHTGRTNGTAYYYIVVAKSSDGTSSDSSEDSATSLATPSISVAGGDTQTTTTWSAVTGANSYDLYWNTTGSPTASDNVLTGVTSPYNHTSRTNGTTYHYSLVAKTSGGDMSAQSAVDSAVPQVGSPSAPTSVAASVDTSGEIDLSWDAMSGATSYTVYWATSTGVTSGTGTAISLANVTSYTHTGRTNGTEYFYVVTATNAGGTSADSSEVSATSLAAPASVAATADASGEVDVSWNAVTGASGYDLYFGTSSGVTSGTGTQVTGVTSPYTHTGRTNGTAYYYIVVAKSSDGTSSDSSEDSATPLATPSISVSGGNAQTTVSWSGITGASTYDLYWNTTGSPTASDNVLTGVTSPYNHTSRTNGTAYHYSLVAKNGAGDISSQSTVDSATPQVPAPSAPTSVAASVDTSGEIDLSWDAMSGATSYTVYWATSTGVTSGTGTAISLANVTSYTHTGRTNGTEYFYVVTATNAGGTSADSSEVSATSLAAPASVAATADASGEVDVSWNAVTGASGYDLYFGTSSGVTSGTGTQVTGVTSPYTHTGRTNGTAYYYIVVAKSSDGTSSDSSEDSATSLATPSISVAGGDTQTTTTWSAVTGANSYDLYWNTTGSPTSSDTVITGVTSPYSHTGRTNGTTYHYSLVAKTSGGDISAQSAVDSVAPQSAGSGIEHIHFTNSSISTNIGVCGASTAVTIEAHDSSHSAQTVASKQIRFRLSSGTLGTDWRIYSDSGCTILLSNSAGWYTATMTGTSHTVYVAQVSGGNRLITANFDSAGDNLTSSQGINGTQPDQSFTSASPAQYSLYLSASLGAITGLTTQSPTTLESALASVSCPADGPCSNDGVYLMYNANGGTNRYTYMFKFAVPSTPASSQVESVDLFLDGSAEAFIGSYYWDGTNWQTLTNATLVSGLTDADLSSGYLYVAALGWENGGGGGDIIGVDYASVNFNYLNSNEVLVDYLNINQVNNTTVGAETCTAFSASLYDNAGNPVAIGGSIDVEFTENSSTGSFYSQADCRGTVSNGSVQVTIADGESSATVYFKDSANTGSFTLTAASVYDYGWSNTAARTYSGNPGNADQININLDAKQEGLHAWESYQPFHASNADYSSDLVYDKYNNRYYYVGTYANSTDYDIVVKAFKNTPAGFVLDTDFNTTGIDTIDTAVGSQPVNAAVDSQGNLYVCGKEDFTGGTFDFTLRKFDASTGHVSSGNYPIIVASTDAEHCYSMAIQNEGGKEYIYAAGTQSNGGDRDAYITKMNLDGSPASGWSNIVINGGSGDDAAGFRRTPTYGGQGLVFSKTGNYFYVSVKLYDGANYNDYIYRYDLNGGSGSSVLWGTGTVTSVISMAMGFWQGTEYLWGIDYTNQTVRRFSTSLSEALNNDEGCHNLGFTAWTGAGVEILIDNYGSDTLYLMGTVISGVPSGKIEQYHMNAGANCISDNDASDPWDAATDHVFAKNGLATWFHSMAFNDTGDLVIVGDTFYPTNRDNHIQYYIGNGIQADVIMPTIGTGPSAGTVTSTSIEVNWGAATDNVDAAGELKYQVRISDDSNDVDDLIAMQAGCSGVCQEYNDLTALLPATFSSLISGTTYYINVVVSDDAGNKAAYSYMTQTTP